MPSKVDRFFDEMQGRRIAFIGMGVTNFNIIKLFVRKGLDVTVCDRSTAEKLGAAYDELAGLGVQFVLGDGYLDTLTD